MACRLRKLRGHGGDDMPADEETSREVRPQQIREHTGDGMFAEEEEELDGIPHEREETNTSGQAKREDSIGLPAKEVSISSLDDVVLKIRQSRDESKFESREAFLEAEVSRLTLENNQLKSGHGGPAAKPLMLSGAEAFEFASMTVASEPASSTADFDDVGGMLQEASESEASEVRHGDFVNDMQLSPDTNLSTIMGSALAIKSRAGQVAIYSSALAGVLFVLVAKAIDLKLWADTDHRRLGGEASMLIVNIAYCVFGAGLIAFLVNALKQPLILGYLLGGILVGPVGLDIVHSYEEITEVSTLGLIFLLFMIGLELDVSELAKMGKVVLITGSVQFPLCACIMASIFMALEALGLSFGEGQHSALYCGMACSISSTMIVVKLLSEHAEMDSKAGRLTVGILIFQDIWAIIVLAIQPDLAKPQILGLLKTGGSIVVLVVVALTYAKFVMPAVLAVSSGSVELMLVVALAWCFCLGCFATLPFVGQSFELAALIAGVALATFPYSAEFIGKIKYIRDFFITLFFVGLGMQIPAPSLTAIAYALIVAFVVLVIRWIGIFGVVYMLGGGPRLATVATINLSQISEFALVICSLGMSYGHVEKDTLTILIWTFSMLAILSSKLIGYNYQIYGLLCRRFRFFWEKGRGRAVGDTTDAHTDDGDHADRNIVFLGFHKVAALLIAHFEHYSPSLLAHIHVIDYHEHIMKELRKRGVTCAYGDISSPDVLEHAHHGDVRLVISSVSDAMLKGVNNLTLLRNAKQVWPSADVIVTGTTPEEAHTLYENGADYVLRMAKLCAERLHDLIVDHSTHAVHHQHLGEETKLSHVFAHFKKTEAPIPNNNSLIQTVANKK